jgi:hypothetical protein
MGISTTSPCDIHVDIFCSTHFPLPAALYSSLFPSESEAAFANYRLWESAGFIAAFAWSSHLCYSVKLLLTSIFFYLGSVLLLVVLIKDWKSRRNASVAPLEMEAK